MDIQSNDTAAGFRVEDDAAAGQQRFVVAARIAIRLNAF
jgi:hypothetical protein